MNSMKPALILASLALGAMWQAPAHAADVPARRPGLWEITTKIEGNARTLAAKQCVDAATDQLMQSSTGPFSPSLCTRDAKITETGMTIDSHCTIGSKTGTAHAIITGSFEDGYTMTVTSEGGGLAPVKITIEGKWRGACPADLAAGDIVMPNGAKINILQLHGAAPK